MMPGAMRHLITVRRAAMTPDEYGAEVAAWGDIASLRAALVEDAAAEDMGETAGTMGRRMVTFRIRECGLPQIGDRVTWRGAHYEIAAFTLAEGRRLDLKCRGLA